jgi:hypothetical protein
MEMQCNNRCMTMQMLRDPASREFGHCRCSEECAHREGRRLRDRGEERDAHAKCEEDDE